MTEKRFKSINCGLLGQYIKDNGKILTIEDVVKLLNELNNQADAVREELRLCEEENTELQKENEQLKKEINMLKTTIGRNEAYIQRITLKGEWK